MVLSAVKKALLALRILSLILAAPLIASLQVAVASDDDFAGFVAGNEGSLQLQQLVLSPNGHGLVAMRDPLFGDSAVSASAEVYVSTRPVPSLLAGLDTLAALGPLRLAGDTVQHPTIGDVRQVELAHGDGLSVWVDTKGAVFFEEGGHVTFLTQLSETFYRTGDLSELAAAERFFDGLQVTMRTFSQGVAIIGVQGGSQPTPSEAFRDVKVAVRLAPVDGTSLAVPPFSTSMVKLSWGSSQSVDPSQVPAGLDGLGDQSSTSGSPSWYLEMLKQVLEVLSAGHQTTPTEPAPVVESEIDPAMAALTCATQPMSALGQFSVRSVTALQLEVPVVKATPSPTPTSTTTTTTTTVSLSPFLKRLALRGAVLPSTFQPTSNLVPYVFLDGRVYRDIPTELMAGQQFLVLWLDPLKLPTIQPAVSGIRIASFRGTIKISSSTGGVYNLSSTGAVRALASFRSATTTINGTPTVTIAAADLKAAALMRALGSAFEVWEPEGCKASVRFANMQGDLTALISTSLRGELAKANSCYGAVPGTQEAASCPCGSQLTTLDQMLTTSPTMLTADEAEQAYRTASAGVVSKVAELGACIQSAHPNLNVGDLGVFEAISDAVVSSGTQQSGVFAECNDARTAAFRADPAEFPHDKWFALSEADFIAREALSSEDLSDLKKRCICNRGSTYLKKVLGNAQALQAVQTRMEYPAKDLLRLTAEEDASYRSAVSLARTRLLDLTERSEVLRVRDEMRRNGCERPLECGDRADEALSRAARQARRDIKLEYLKDIPEPRRSEIASLIDRINAQHSEVEQRRDRSADDILKKKICYPADVAEARRQCSALGNGKGFNGSLLQEAGAAVDSGDPADTGLQEALWDPLLLTAQVNWLDSDYETHLCSQPLRCENKQSAIFGKPLEWLLPEKTATALQNLALFKSLVPIQRKILTQRVIVKWLQLPTGSRSVESPVFNSKGEPVFDESFLSYFKGKLNYSRPLCDVSSCEDALSASTVKSVVHKDGKSNVTIGNKVESVENIGFALIEPDASKREYLGDGQYQLKSLYCRAPLPTCVDTISNVDEKTYLEAGQTEDWTPNGDNKRLRYSLWHYPRRVCLRQQLCSTSGSAKFRYTRGWACELEANPHFAQIESDPTIPPQAKAKMSKVLVCRAELEQLPCGSSSATVTPTPVTTSTPAVTPTSTTSLTSLLSSSSATQLKGSDLGDSSVTVQATENPSVYSLKKVFPIVETKMYDGTTLLIRKLNHLPLENDANAVDGGVADDDLAPVQDSNTTSAQATPAPGVTPNATPAPVATWLNEDATAANPQAANSGLAGFLDRLKNTIVGAWNQLYQASQRPIDHFTGVSTGSVVNGMLEYDKLWAEAERQATSQVAADSRFPEYPDDKFEDGPRKAEIQRIAAELFLPMWESSSIPPKVKGVVMARIEAANAEAESEAVAEQEAALKRSGAAHEVKRLSKQLQYLQALQVIARCGFLSGAGDAASCVEQRAMAIEVLEDHGDIEGWESVLVGGYYQLMPKLKATALYRFDFGSGTIQIESNVFREQLSTLFEQWTDVAKGLQDQVRNGTISFATYKDVTGPLMGGYQALNEFVEGRLSFEAMEESMSELRWALAAEVATSIIPVGTVAKFASKAVRGTRAVSEVADAFRMYKAFAAAKLGMLADKGVKASRALAVGRQIGAMASRFSGLARRLPTGAASAAIMNHYFSRGVSLGRLSIDAAFSDPNEALINHAFEMTTRVDESTGEIRTISGITEVMVGSIKSSLKSMAYGGVAAVGRYGPAFAAFTATYHSMRPEVHNVLFGQAIAEASELRKGLEILGTRWVEMKVAYARGDIQETARQLSHIGLDSALMAEDYIDVISGARGAVGFSKRETLHMFRVDASSSGDPLDDGDIPTSSSLEKEKLVLSPDSPVFDKLVVKDYNKTTVVSRQKMRTAVSSLSRQLPEVYRARPGLLAAMRALPVPPTLFHGTSSAALVDFAGPLAGQAQLSPPVFHSLDLDDHDDAALDNPVTFTEGFWKLDSTDTTYSIDDLSPKGIKATLAAALPKAARSAYRGSWSPQLYSERMERLGDQRHFLDERDLAFFGNEMRRSIVWDTLSDYQRGLIFNQFEVVFGIHTDRLRSVVLKDPHGDVELLGGTEGDEIKAVFVPSDRVEEVKKLLSAERPEIAVLDIQLLRGQDDGYYQKWKTHLEESLEMMQDRDYAQAIQHLRDLSLDLVRAGYTITFESTRNLEALTTAAVRANLAANDKWSFDAKERKLVLSIANRPSDLVPVDDAQRTALREWEQANAIRTAEVFISVLQDLHGGAISDYTPVFGGKFTIPLDVDRALVFQRFYDAHPSLVGVEKGTALGYALDRVYGRQSEEEEELFYDELMDAPRNTPVGLRTFADGPIVLTVTKTDEGYEVNPQPDSKVFGYYLPIKGPAVLLDRKVTLESFDYLLIGFMAIELP